MRFWGGMLDAREGWSQRQRKTESMRPPKIEATAMTAKAPRYPSSLIATGDE